MKPNRFHFRAWDGKKMRVKESGNAVSFGGRWCVGYIDGDMLSDFDGCEDAVIMQSTGLADSHGKEIFEGDIIAIGDISGARAVVTWDDEHDPCWMLMGNRLKSWNFGERAKEDYVIGNIYENPELLK